ncbi:hypothetical protein Cni_G22423 [Canna indica]|uniref:Uncharacterized protein n=1 Tax=Canna indica TaxID=4628 RepID=A0AAQ3QMM3_9LILI|nr:hypothetical protein Cni_G22423 [Canna indica]
MILVDGANGEWPVIEHALWNGCNPADFVMPSFIISIDFRLSPPLNALPSSPNRFFGVCVIVIYFAVIYGTYVPDWEFTVHDTESSDYGKFFKLEMTIESNAHGLVATMSISK